jgi:hypothetical protein
MSKKMKIIIRIFFLVVIIVAVYFAIRAYPNPGDRFWGVGG